MTKALYHHLRKRKYRFLGLGLGVQSTTLACMAALGEIQPFDALYFVDNGWERSRTYEALKFYAPWLEQHSQPITIIKIDPDLAFSKDAHPPFYTATGGLLKRLCTPHMKVIPQACEMRRFAGFPPHKAQPAPAKKQFTHVLGISLDEYHRMANSHVQYIELNYPLVDMKMTRDNCITWLADHNLPNPGKSGCYFCPYRRTNDYLDAPPEEIQAAIAFDEKIRRLPWDESEFYIFTDRKKRPIPLKQADFLQPSGGDDYCTGPFCNT